MLLQQVGCVKNVILFLKGACEGYPLVSFTCTNCKLAQKEFLKRIKKRVKKFNDAESIYELGGIYRRGELGLTKNIKRTFELWKQAAELGLCRAHNDLSLAYLEGMGVEQDNKKATHHLELAAIGGHERARFNLGHMEFSSGNIDVAMKHYMIAARGGEDKSLKFVGEGYKVGFITKDDYAKTLRSYQNISNEMKSEQRTKAMQMNMEKYSR